MESINFCFCLYLCSQIELFCFILAFYKKGEKTVIIIALLWSSNDGANWVVMCCCLSEIFPFFKTGGNISLKYMTFHPFLNTAWANISFWVEFVFTERPIRFLLQFYFIWFGFRFSFSKLFCFIFFRHRMLFCRFVFLLISTTARCTTFRHPLKVRCNDKNIFFHQLLDSITLRMIQFKSWHLLSLKFVSFGFHCSQVRIALYILFYVVLFCLRFLDGWSFAVSFFFIVICFVIENRTFFISVLFF